MERKKRVRLFSFFIFSVFTAFVLIHSPNLSCVVRAEQGAQKSDVRPIADCVAVTEVFDWGPAVAQVIVNLGEPVEKGALAEDTFRVHVVRTESRSWVKLSASDAEGDRDITHAYVSDADGNAVDQGNYATLELQVGPEIGLAYPIHYDIDSDRNDWVDCRYTVTQVREISSVSGRITGLVADNQSKNIKKLVDLFKAGNFVNSSAAADTELTYAEYTPAEDGGKHPLIIWLHGTGEIGTDPMISIVANKSCRFASPETQSIFGGAYVLVPQYTSLWMEGEVESALMALIQNYASSHQKIDKRRIYLGGASNGGYMAVALARDYPDYFAAVFPACEAMLDLRLSDEDIENMKNIPLWFTAAKTDTLVPPEEYAAATYHRLVQAGAENIHFSYFDKVEDTTGLYRQQDGSPYEYNGHFSFFYVFNNQCTDTINGEETNILQWLAAQKKPEPQPVQKTVSSADSGSDSKAVSPARWIAVFAALLAVALIFMVIRKNRDRKRSL